MKHEREHKLIDLYDYLKYDNIGLNSNESIRSDLFPEQVEDKLGLIIPLWYMDERFHIKERGEFVVIRWDSDGNRVILVNDKLEIILVSDSSRVDEDGTDQKDEIGQHVSNSYIHQYPIQMDELLGVHTEDMFLKDRNINAGIIVRADAGGQNPQFVILEDASKHRILTLDETHPRIQREDPKAKSHPLHSKYDWWPKDWGV